VAVQQSFGVYMHFGADVECALPESALEGRELHGTIDGTPIRLVLRRGAP
jgi:hypothetical protein